jgi:hypothetical protein
MLNHKKGSSALESEELGIKLQDTEGWIQFFVYSKIV